MSRSRAPFFLGTAAGAALTLMALALTGPDASATLQPAASEATRLGAWLTLNLGHAAWLFALITGLFTLHLRRLVRLLNAGAPDRGIVALDQLTDVWIHLFVGVGVIWTAVGMRAALQAALADPQHALADTAGSVLQKLVDGGILLALTTTIVGGVGGYLMRLVKTALAGAELHDHYDRVERQPLADLLDCAQRIERALSADARPIAGAVIDGPAR
ncbi:MAG: hypothetical protein R3E86_03470 [Pseudomonadales bacterium]